MTTFDRPTAAGVFVVRDPDVCAALEQLLAPHRTTTTVARQSDDTALLAAAQRHAVNLIAGPDETPPVGETIEQVLDRVHGSAFSEGRAQATAAAREAAEEKIDNEVRERIHHLEAEAEQTQRLLAQAVADLEAERTARRAADQEADQLKARIVDLQTDLATTGRELELANGQVRTLRERVDELHSDLDEARKAPPAPLAPRATGSRIADKRAFSALAELMENQARVAKSADARDTLRLASRAVRDEIAKVYGPGGKKAS